MAQSAVLLQRVRGRGAFSMQNVTKRSKRSRVERYVSTWRYLTEANCRRRCLALQPRWRKGKAPHFLHNHDNGFHERNR